jgi:DNA mismatch repair protein MutL
LTQINHKRNRIKILPEYIINKISAGEIVNRPASVVKELIENSIDAESTRIVVDIKDGGKKLIWVSDNGCGMDKDDVKLAFERHATSKITCMEDLDRIESLGFRGEALPSIAAVSRVEVVTCTEGAISGTLLKIEGGVIKEIKDTGAPQGTSIKVKDLFFNTPVRRKFLRAITTETGHINFIVSRIAMSYPHISFKLLHNGVEVINVEATKDLYERLSCFLGDEMKDKVIPVKFIVSSVKIYGVIYHPHIHDLTGICSLYL